MNWVRVLLERHRGSTLFHKRFYWIRVSESCTHFRWNDSILGKFHFPRFKVFKRKTGFLVVPC